jgi:subtilisin family serine protease
VAKVISSIAPNSKLIIVIPVIEGHPRFFVSYELALKHIKYIAQSEKYKQPFIINISQGIYSGGRDGNSQIEKTFDRFSNHAKAPGIVIVTAAGNGRDKKSHAKLVVSTEESSFLCWRAVNKYRAKHKIELWFNPQNKIKFRLINPDDQESEWVCQDKIKEKSTFPSNDVYELSYKVKDGNVDITIFAAPNAQVIQTGEWKLEIVGTSLKDPDDDIHAWIQHIDGRVSERAIEFSDPDQVDEKITLTTFGTAKTVITVGSVDPNNPLAASKFSSLGPTRDGREQPILVASGDGGTSFAAPRVTAAIALLLSARKKQCELDPNLSQFNAADIKQIMSEMTQNSNENWSHEIGYGALDIEKLIGNLDMLARRVMTNCLE